MFDPIQFLTPNYLFDVNPGSNMPSYGVWLTFFGILFVIAIAIFILLRVKKFNPPLKRVLKPIPMKLEIFGGVGILLILFRLGNAYYLSMRFFLLVWFIIFVWYLVLLFKKIKQYPSELEFYLQREESKKYHSSFSRAKKKKKKKSSK